MKNNLLFFCFLLCCTLGNVRAGTNDECQARDSARPPVAPLLGKIEWGQLAPYNQRCPKDACHGCVCKTGCLATAVGQVMRYWQWPQHGRGKHSYLLAALQVIDSADFENTAYDWANMLDTYRQDFSPQQADAVAVLLAHIGVAAEMRYRCKGASADLASTIHDVAHYFRYTLDTVVTDSLQFYIDAELDAGRPVLMSGRSLRAGGHIFVCDGRDAAGNYHFNWGDNGTHNCYCPLSRIQPEGTEIWFNSSVKAVIGFRPE